VYPHTLKRRVLLPYHDVLPHHPRRRPVLRDDVLAHHGAVFHLRECRASAFRSPMLRECAARRRVECRRVVVLPCRRAESKCDMIQRRLPFGRIVAFSRTWTTQLLAGCRALHCRRASTSDHHHHTTTTTTTPRAPMRRFEVRLFGNTLAAHPRGVSAVSRCATQLSHELGTRISWVMCQTKHVHRAPRGRSHGEASSNPPYPPVL